MAEEMQDWWKEAFSSGTNFRVVMPTWSSSFRSPMEGTGKPLFNSWNWQLELQ